MQAEEEAYQIKFTFHGFQFELQVFRRSSQDEKLEKSPGPINF